MQKPIRLNAFAMNCVGHQATGLWRHPRDNSARYRHADYWTSLARTLERGCFDGVFLADVLGVYDVFRGTADAALIDAVQVPVNDPLLLVPLMAGVTSNLGFGVTCALTYEHPYPFARRMSTLDHLTDGRVGWNIVTSYLDSAARNMGLTRQMAHDDRYELAEEYMEVCYKLWEGCWEDDAVVRDRARGVFTDPTKVHPIAHHGANYQVPGIHLCEPSPQRTPLLYQAGASARGKTFAARHAECVFVNGPTPAIVKSYVDDIRATAVSVGRDPADILIYAMFTAITAPTQAEAEDKYAECRGHVSLDGALALMSGWTGVDLGALAENDVVEYSERDANRSALESFTKADPTRRWTVREIAEWVGIGGRGPLAVGTPVEIADRLQAFQAETGVDGFNLTYVVAHETFEDFVALVVPELQRRGVHQREYRAGTLREKLFGKGPKLSAPHVGASYRR
ncbi:MAG: LLM class flavin-dependent oxidoreductase [Gammaproteobacteria bacterium]|nr:LLM class flavin-dependent oxidoreductase [Gammaproteobacteria bacterium]